jgi:hypothetical protein
LEFAFSLQTFHFSFYRRRALLCQTGLPVFCFVFFSSFFVSVFWLSVSPFWTGGAQYVGELKPQGDNISKQ